MPALPVQAKQLSFPRKTLSVWQHGFFDRAVRRECNLIALSRYIVANPLRAGLVEEIGDYPLWDAVWMNHSRSEERSNSGSARN